MAARSSLSPQRFDKLKESLKQQLERLTADFAERIRQLLLSHSSDLARCSTLQRKEIKKILAPCDKGYHLSDMVEKAVLHGEGMMARHLVTNLGITSITFKKLPAAAKRQLSSGIIPIAERNRVVQVKAKDLTARQMSRAVSGNHPSLGVLTPVQQKSMSRYRKPVYHGLTGDEPDGRSIILTWELNTSCVKGRITLGQLKALVRKYEALSRPKPQRARKTA